MTAPLADAEVAEEADAEPEGYVCGPCQRNKHRACRAPECTCCEGDPG